MKADGFDWANAKQVLPDSLLCSQNKIPVTRKPRLLSAMAFSPTLEASFSGTTYYLANAGLETGHLEGCFSLYSAAKPPRAFQMRGALWKLSKMVRREPVSGFKFTAAYADYVWPRYIHALAGTTVVNNMQIYGQQFFNRRKSYGIGAYYYFDGTLAEYFEEYDKFDAADIAPSTRKHAVELEEQGYWQADGIIVMSKASALALHQRYRVPLEKISVVVPGANLIDAQLDAIEKPQQPDIEKEFVLGFVGLYPLRKRLDLLADAVSILRRQGQNVRLRVIGKCPEEIQKMDGVEFLGVINKKTNLPDFVKALGSTHLGCLVSRSELAGIAALEFLRLGLPFLGARVGGATDILEGGGGLAVDPDVTPEELAVEIGALCKNPDRYAALKRAAEQKANWASWRRAAAELDKVLP